MHQQLGALPKVNTRLSWAKPALFALALASASAAQAGFFTAIELAAIAPDSASATYTSGSVVMTLQEADTATMLGSDNVDFEGLWLGADGTGGGYSMAFNAPLSSFSLSFIALTALDDVFLETLNAWLTNAASTTTFTSADGSASWDGSTLTPLTDDGRGVLTFTSASAGGFSGLSFNHIQPDQLQGFIINRIDFTLADVVVNEAPEPATAVLLASGLLGVWGVRRRANRANAQRARKVVS